MMVLCLLTTSAWALPWDNATIPEDISEQGYTWFINELDGLYDYDDEIPHFVKSNDLSLIISEFDLEGDGLYDDLGFQTGNSEVLHGDSGGTLNIITKNTSVVLPLTYDNLTDLSGSLNVSFYGGASLSAEGLEANDSADVTMNVSIPSTRGFYTVDTVSLGDSVWPQVNPWVDCLEESLFNKVLIARVLDRSYYEVRYSNYGGAIPYGYPAGGYPLIRRDLTPSRFSDDEDLDIDLGTVFVNKYDSWPSYTDVPGSYDPYDPTWNDDYPQKGRSLMVKVTNWGDEQQVTDIHPLNTGFEAFNLRMKKIDCGTDWPAWGWYYYLDDYYGEGWDSGNFENFNWGDAGSETYEWPLPPAYSVMYWGGKFSNDTVSGGIPYNRDYQDGENSFYVEVGGNTFTLTWTPREFETLGSIYPSPNEDDVDFLASHAWTGGSNVPVPDPAEPYQGSGVVMHLVSFDIPSSDLGGMNAFLPDYDFESESADIVTLEQLDEEDSIVGNLTYAAIVDVPFDSVPYGWEFVPVGIEASEVDPDELAVMPVHAFAFLTEDLMRDVDEDAYEEFVQALEEDAPLDVAFLENFRLFNYGAEGTRTDLIQLVESAGREPTNYFRVVGNKYRVCVHFFAVLADSDNLGVEVKDGYFLISDGNKDQSFNTSFAGTVAPSNAVTDPTSGSGGGGCNASSIPAVFGLLMVPLMFLMRK